MATMLIGRGVRSTNNRLFRELQPKVQPVVTIAKPNIVLTDPDAPKRLRAKLIASGAITPKGE